MRLAHKCLLYPIIDIYGRGGGGREEGKTRWRGNKGTGLLLRIVSGVDLMNSIKLVTFG
jgi:hypothetical protein